MTQYIKAPFNFVPLNNKVYFPDWHHQVSHDIPFSDGESGEIELELEAMTPIFVRNGHTKSDAKNKNEDYVSFSKKSDGYFIPGTSLKGMFRNVLEIMSFGKMRQISNDRYGFRDLQNRKEYLPLSETINCGYMVKESSNVIKIIDHGIPYRISHKNLDSKLNSSLVSYCSKKENLTSDLNRTASKKYQLAGNINKVFLFKQIKNELKNPVDKRRFVEISEKGNIKGKIILTGQPDVRQQIYDRKKAKGKWIGKFYEFVFPEQPLKEEIIPMNDKNDLRFKDFLFIHKDSNDWAKFWKISFDKKNQVPIFFIKDAEGKILHFGLSYLYKIPYLNRIKDCLHDPHKTSDLDLPEIMFGSHQAGSKGRIQVSHAKLISGEEDKRLEPLMGSPKASYYPIYLQQESSNGHLLGNFYNTYSSKKPLLKGWKRYPIHKNEIRTFQVDANQMKNTSPFIPLSSGSKFLFKIRFHNLRKIEIGAILKSILLNKADQYHTLGFAKPYGYGKCKISIISSSLKEHEDIYINKFLENIEIQIPKWHKTDQILEFDALTQVQNNDEDLVYMSLSQFADAKSVRKNNGNQLTLPYYTDYINKNNPIKLIKKGPNIGDRIKLPIQEKPIQEIIIQKVDIQDDWIEGIYIKGKRVKLSNSNDEVALVIPKTKMNIQMKEGDKVWVKIKQKKKDGSINQVELMIKK